MDTLQIDIDDHKLHQHPLEVAKWLQGHESWETAKTLYPIYIEISPYGGCNFRCSFCAKDFLKYKPTKIAVPVLKKSLSVMKQKGVKSVLFAGEGEPLLYKELAEIFEHGAQVGIDMALNSNFAVDNPSALQAAARHARWIRASVNAGTPEEHQEVHQCSPKAFDKVFENLALTVEERNRSGSSTTIGTQAVLLENNKDSMIQLARRARAVGVNYLVIKPYSQHPESLTHQHENTDYRRAGDLADLLRREETEKFRVYFRTSAFERARSHQHSYGHCFSVPVFWAYIRSNGDVGGCNAFLTDPKFRFGNLNDEDFDRIWEGEGRRANFEHMKSHDISRCRLNCRMEKVNEYLWKLKNPSTHVNFI
jgi:radical SAM protein with 4Fe4S-binding SPASM domain